MAASTSAISSCSVIARNLPSTTTTRPKVAGDRLTARQRPAPPTNLPQLLLPEAVRAPLRVRSSTASVDCAALGPMLARARLSCSQGRGRRRSTRYGRACRVQGTRSWRCPWAAGRPRYDRHGPGGRPTGHGCPASRRWQGVRRADDPHDRSAGRGCRQNRRRGRAYSSPAPGVRPDGTWRASSRASRRAGRRCTSS